MAIQIRFKAVKENKKEWIEKCSSGKEEEKAYFLQSTNLCLKKHFLLHTIQFSCIWVKLKVKSFPEIKITFLQKKSRNNKKGKNKVCARAWIEHQVLCKVYLEKHSRNFWINFVYVVDSVNFPWLFVHVHI